MSFSDAPELVIKRKRRRNRLAIDPGLGYGERSSSPLTSSKATPELDRTHHSPNALPQLSQGIPNCSGSPKDQSLLSPKHTPPLTVEAFFRTVVAHPLEGRAPPLGTGTTQGESVHTINPAKPPVIRRYRRARRVRSSCDPSQQRPQRKPSYSLRRKKRFSKSTVRGTRTSTCHPLQLSPVAIAPPETPAPHKRRWVDPHVSATLVPASLDGEARLVPSHSTYKKILSWVPKVSAFVSSLVPSMEPAKYADRAPHTVGQRPATTRLQFVPLKDHQERIADVFRPTSISHPVVTPIHQRMTASQSSQRHAVSDSSSIYRQPGGGAASEHPSSHHLGCSAKMGQEVSLSSCSPDSPHQTRYLHCVPIHHTPPPKLAAHNRPFQGSCRSTDDTPFSGLFSQIHPSDTDTRSTAIPTNVLSVHDDPPILNVSHATQSGSPEPPGPPLGKQTWKPTEEGHPMVVDKLPLQEAPQEASQRHQVPARRPLSQSGPLSQTTSVFQESISPASVAPSNTPRADHSPDNFHLGT